MAIFKVTPLLLAAITSFFSLEAFAATISLNVTNSVTINNIAYKIVEYIERDVVVIGGGSSGTYAAIGLLDSNKTVAVIDNQDRMGGHTNTYTDPATGLTEDYGVVIYHNIDIVKTYAARLNVPLAVADISGGSTVYADFRTGIENSTYSTAGFTTGLALYIAQLEKYSYVETGFELPSPVPEDLLLSFGDFAIKYKLGDEFLGFLFNFAQGLGDLLSKPTLYVFKNFGMGVIDCLTTGFLGTAAHDNSLIYENAQAIIGNDNVFLSATIVAVNRNGDCVQVLISTPSGYKFIEAQKLIFTIPPKIDNLTGWDLSTTEITLFSQFNNCGYYTAVFTNTGLPTGISITNIGENTTYGFPPLPAAYSIGATAIPEIYNMYYGSPTSLPDNEVQAAMFAEIGKLQLLNKNNDTSTPELLAYSRHTPFELWVPAEAIEAGFYGELYGLQGERNTWYTGAAFHTHDSSMLWQFTEALMKEIIASLE
ncbi:hypothetical protein SBOR_8936 [Sclerotinia borealis F-4128]|uniref:Amine oxidase domain-containing protein n=1 Tax=Sclerotinia borealis (strain F-4128) TaxID=1432307 RepID=W9C701_SCLBF|nr:hypothetical protein SBOR_8936 [Sclerotinia borealis F-4128]